jgi:hypothetical protein
MINKKLGSCIFLRRPFFFFLLITLCLLPQDRDNIFYGTTNIHTGCPRVAKKLHNLFVIKDINFFFFLDDSYASTAYSENIAVYIQVYIQFPNIIKTLKLCFFKWKLPSSILFLNSMLNYESNLYRSFLLICHRF